MSSIRTALDERLRRVRGEEDGVALISAVLFMILLAGMSLVLLSVILGQIGPSYAAQKGTKTVYSAQAGLQAALGVVRSAAGTVMDPNGVPYGSLAKLPCSFSGNLDGSSADLSYNVAISYYLLDPTGKNDTWLAANKLGCSASGVADQPNFAYMVSNGVGIASPGRPAAEGNRSVAAIYTFKVTNVNIPGGRIFDFAKSECLEAKNISGPTNAPGVGSEIEFKSNCVADNADRDERQLWVYDDSYQIKLASTIDTSLELCITGVPTNRATLQTCKTDATRWNQLWSWDGQHTWWGQQQTISAGYSNARFKNDNDYLVIDTGFSTFAPQAAVGPAAAGVLTHQIVNYKEFGRCTDVTDTKVLSAFMITYPCKQDPSNTGGSKLAWNHEWYYTEPTSPATSLDKQAIYIREGKVDSGKMCLQAPAAGGKYPTLASCDSAKTSQQWTRNQKTGNVATSYTFINQNLCLTADGADLYNSNWSKITLVACTGGENQKWNAPAVVNDATFGSFKEIGG